jgi:hypothetical protein
VQRERGARGQRQVVMQRLRCSRQVVVQRLRRTGSEVLTAERRVAPPREADLAFCI